MGMRSLGKRAYFESKCVYVWTIVFVLYILCVLCMCPYVCVCLFQCVCLPVSMVCACIL